MNPRVTEVSTLDGYRLRLVFSNGERKIFDASPIYRIRHSVN